MGKGLGPSVSEIGLEEIQIQSKWSKHCQFNLFTLNFMHVSSIEFRFAIVKLN